MDVSKPKKLTIDNLYSAVNRELFFITGDIYEKNTHVLNPELNSIVVIPFMESDTEPVYIKIMLTKFQNVNFNFGIISCIASKTSGHNRFILEHICDNRDGPLNTYQKCKNCGSVIFTTEMVQCCADPDITIHEGRLEDFEMDNKFASDSINNETLMKEAQRCIDRIKANDGSVKNLSDGYHTFDELYNHRALLFASLCMTTFKHCSWKSLLHHDPDDPMFDKMFIVGIETPYGQATYHYNIDPYWSMFNVREVPRAPKFDGHSPTDAINRIYKYAMDIATKPALRRDESFNGIPINPCGNNPK